MKRYIVADITPIGDESFDSLRSIAGNPHVSARTLQRIYDDQVEKRADWTGILSQVILNPNVPESVLRDAASRWANSSYVLALIALHSNIPEDLLNQILYGKEGKYVIYELVDNAAAPTELLTRFITDENFDLKDREILALAHNENISPESLKYLIDEYDITTELSIDFTSTDSDIAISGNIQGKITRAFSSNPRFKGCFVELQDEVYEDGVTSYFYIAYVHFNMLYDISTEEKYGLVEVVEDILENNDCQPGECDSSDYCAG